MDTVPGELVQMICLYCPVSTIARLAQASLSLHSAVMSTYLWERLLAKDWGVTSKGTDPFTEYRRLTDKFIHRESVPKLVSALREAYVQTVPDVPMLDCVRVEAQSAPFNLHNKGGCNCLDSFETDASILIPAGRIYTVELAIGLSVQTQTAMSNYYKACYIHGLRKLTFQGEFLASIYSRVDPLVWELQLYPSAAEGVCYLSKRTRKGSSSKQPTPFSVQTVVDTIKSALLSCCSDRNIRRVIKHRLEFFVDYRTPEPSSQIETVPAWCCYNGVCGRFDSIWCQLVYYCRTDQMDRQCRDPERTVDRWLTSWRNLELREWDSIHSAHPAIEDRLTKALKGKARVSITRYGLDDANVRLYIIVA